MSCPESPGIIWSHRLYRWWTLGTNHRVMSMSIHLLSPDWSFENNRHFHIRKKQEFPGNDNSMVAFKLLHAFLGPLLVCLSIPLLRTDAAYQVVRKYIHFNCICMPAESGVLSCWCIEAFRASDYIQRGESCAGTWMSWKNSRSSVVCSND